MNPPVKPVPEGYHSITPYLIVKNAKDAIEFYKSVFDAREKDLLVMPDGKIGHAELIIGNSVIMLADEFPDIGALSPETVGGSPVSILVYLEDVDLVFQRALDAGATQEKPVENQFYGDRSGSIKDPFGHKWTIATHVEDVSPEEMKNRAEALFGGNGSC